MLSEKPWKADAVVRLVAGVIVCIFAGSLLVSILHFSNRDTQTSARVFFPLAAAGMMCLGTTLVLMRVPPRAENLVGRLFVLLVCFYAGVFLGAWAQKLAGPAGNTVVHMLIGTLSFQGAGLALVALFLHDHGMSWGEAFGFGHQSRHAVLFGVITACLFLPVGWGLQQLSALAVSHIHHFGLHPEEQQAVQTLRSAVAWFDRVALGVVTIVLAPLAEEILFRGILYPWIKQAGFPRLALWGTSLLFAAIHLNLITFLPLLILAILLTVLYEWTDNLLAPVAAHSLFNGLNFAVLYLFDKSVR